MTRPPRLWRGELQLCWVVARLGLRKTSKVLPPPSMTNAIAPLLFRYASQAGGSSVPVTVEDLIGYGFLPEFVGRFPVTTQLLELTEEQMVRAVDLYQRLFCFWACVHDTILFSAHPPFV